MLHKDFEFYYEVYYFPLFLYAYSLTKNKEDAEDLVANAFVKAFLSFKKGNFEAWIYTVLKNEFYQFYKKRKRVIQENDLNINNIPFEDDVVASMVEREKKRWLYSQIYQLPMPDREIMILSLETNLKDEEIAAILGLSISNVRVIRHRVKEKLKKEAPYEYRE